MIEGSMRAAVDALLLGSTGGPYVFRSRPLRISHSSAQTQEGLALAHLFFFEPLFLTFFELLLNQKALLG